MELISDIKSMINIISQHEQPRYALQLVVIGFNAYFQQYFRQAIYVTILSGIYKS